MPLGDCDESAGPFVWTTPVEPDFEAPTDPEVLGSQRTPPDGEPPKPVGAGESEGGLDEPVVGLEQVRREPLEEIAPVPSGAVTSGAALQDSGPTPASIARGSSRSISASKETRGRGVLWCFAASLDRSSEDLSEEGLPLLLGSTVGVPCMAVKESVSPKVCGRHAVDRAHGHGARRSDDRSRLPLSFRGAARS